MITEKELVEALVGKGVTPCVDDFVKNGVKMRGLYIKVNNDIQLCPIVYIDDILKDSNSADSAADTIICITKERFLRTAAMSS